MRDEIISALIDINFPTESRREKQHIVCKRNAKSERDALPLLYLGEGDFHQYEKVKEYLRSLYH